MTVFWHKARQIARRMDYVVFFEKPFLQFERLLSSSLQTFPRSHRVFQEAMISWLGEKLWIKNLIQKRLAVPPVKILFTSIISPMLPAPFSVPLLKRQLF